MRIFGSVGVRTYNLMGDATRTGGMIKLRAVQENSPDADLPREMIGFALSD